MADFLKFIWIATWLGGAFLIFTALQLNVLVPVGLPDMDNVANTHAMHIQMMWLIMGIAAIVCGTISLVGAALLDQSQDHAAHRTEAETAPENP